MIDVIENNHHLPLLAIFNLDLKSQDSVIGNVTIYEHPQDKYGGQVHLYIEPKFRSRWLTRGIKERMLHMVQQVSKKYKLKILYSTAFTKVSPRLLDFFNFIEYNKKTPKKYYYLTIQD